MSWAGVSDLAAYGQIPEAPGKEWAASPWKRPVLRITCWGSGRSLLDVAAMGAQVIQHALGRGIGDDLARPAHAVSGKVIRRSSQVRIPRRIARPNSWLGRRHQR